MMRAGPLGIPHGDLQGPGAETILQLSSRLSRLLGTREMHVLHRAEEDRFVPPV